MNNIYREVFQYILSRGSILGGIIYHIIYYIISYFISYSTSYIISYHTSHIIYHLSYIISEILLQVFEGRGVTTGQFRGKVSLVQTSMSMFLSSMKCLYTLLCSLIEYTMFHEVYLHYTLYTN